jgi:hypothetical protein
LKIYEREVRNPRSVDCSAIDQRGEMIDRRHGCTSRKREAPFSRFRKGPGM